LLLYVQGVGQPIASAAAVVGKENDVWVKKEGGGTEQITRRRTENVARPNEPGPSLKDRIPPALRDGGISKKGVAISVTTNVTFWSSSVGTRSAKHAQRETFSEHQLMLEPKQ
jgi:hypothetical protein